MISLKKRARILILFWGGLIASIMGQLTMLNLLLAETNEVNFTSTLTRHLLFFTCIPVTVGSVFCILGLYSVYKKKRMIYLSSSALVPNSIHNWLPIFLLLGVLYAASNHSSHVSSYSDVESHVRIDITEVYTDTPFWVGVIFITNFSILILHYLNYYPSIIGLVFGLLGPSAREIESFSQELKIQEMPIHIQSGVSTPVQEKA